MPARTGEDPHVEVHQPETHGLPQPVPLGGFRSGRVRKRGDATSLGRAETLLVPAEEELQPKGKIRG